MGIRFTEEQARALGITGSKPKSAPPKPGTAKGQMPPGRMNKTEAAYAERLTYLQHTRQIVWWGFEAVKLRLADNTFYTPDFAVMSAEGFMEMHEVKGFWRDDARVKIKVAAEHFPFRFVAVQKDGKDWKFEQFTRSDA